MARRLGTSIGIVLVSGSIGCLLYTDPVNVAPKVVSIAVAPQPPVRDTPLTFTAVVPPDDQQTPLAYDWGVARGACPASGVPPETDRVGKPGTDPAYTVTLNELGDFCAFVTVTDEHRARDFKTAVFQIVDRPPTALITRVVGDATMPLGASVPLYSDLHFSAAGSSDPDSDSGDVLSYSWTLTAPDASSLPLSPCDPASTDVCFSVLVPGMYQLGVTVDDGHGMSAGSMLTINVAEDQPPCIALTDPPILVQGLVRDPAKPATFTVRQVDDDGDPWPAPAGRPSVASFVWAVRYVGVSGVFPPYVSVDVPTFEIPAGSYQSGQQIEVRVEAHDRRSPAPEIRQCDLVTIDNALCPWPPSSCSQWVTWKVEFL